MADPVSWMMIASTVASVGSQVVGGVQTYQQGQYEADVASTNAKIAQDNAARSRLDAARAEEAQRREARQALGRAAAASSQSGAAGTGPGMGSFGAINTQSARSAELDALNIRYGGETEAFAQENQAAMFKAERKAALQRAKGGLITGVLGAASAGLSGTADYKAYRRTQARTPTKPTKPRRTPTGAAPPPRIDPYHRRP